MTSIQTIGAYRLIKYILYGVWRRVFNILPSPILRKLWMQIGGASVGLDSIIDQIDFINLDRTGLRGLTIHNKCFLGRGVMLDLAAPIYLADHVTIATRSTLITHLNVGYADHPLQNMFHSISRTIKVDSGAFVGAGSIILPGLLIGKSAFIAAGSVVTKNVPANTLVAGVPASPKRHY